MMIAAMKRVWNRILGKESASLQAQIAVLERRLLIQESSWQMACEMVESKDQKEKMLQVKIGELDHKVIGLEIINRRLYRDLSEMQEDFRKEDLFHAPSQDLEPQDLLDISVMEPISISDLMA